MDLYLNVDLNVRGDLAVEVDRYGHSVDGHLGLVGF